MSEEVSDAIPSGWPRYLLAAALLSGAGNGASFLTSDTSDRYHADTARADFAIRDARIAELEREQHRHLQHSAQYTQIIVDLKARIIEHMREHHASGD